jgi:NAD(P)-dependent dehydrogenase (short-subunit alcohol dehydrogenase family)
MRERTALITGGSGYLGVAVTEAFLEDGWHVVVPWFNVAELDRLGEHEGLDTVEADLTDPDDVARAVRVATADEKAPLRALVNLVGGFAAGQPVKDTPLADFEAQFALNLRPTYLVTQCALQHMGPDGAIVCVSSRAALHPFAGAAGYCASKAAVLAFAQCVAQEGVRCNAIVPRKIDTPANRAAEPDSTDYGTPPAEVAKVIRYLCSDAAAAVNGAAVPV